MHFPRVCCSSIAAAAVVAAANVALSIAAQSFSRRSSLQKKRNEKGGEVDCLRRRCSLSLSRSFSRGFPGSRRNSKGHGSVDGATRKQKFRRSTSEGTGRALSSSLSRFQSPIASSTLPAAHHPCCAYRLATARSLSDLEIRESIRSIERNPGVSAESVSADSDAISRLRLNRELVAARDVTIIV